MCVCFTCIHVAVVWRFSSSSCHGSWPLAEWVASIDTVSGPEAHPGSRAGAHVRRRVRQPWKVLCLGGCHCKAHWCHGHLLWKGGRDKCFVDCRRGWTGLERGQVLVWAPVLTWAMLGYLAENGDFYHVLFCHCTSPLRPTGCMPLGMWKLICNNLLSVPTSVKKNPALDK